jgi:hypothetical protein
VLKVLLSVVGIFGLVFLAACSQAANTGQDSRTAAAAQANNPQALFFPRLKPVQEPRPFPQALTTGILERHGRCVYLRDMRDSTRRLVIWNSHIEPQGDFVVDSASRQQVKIGALISLGGGAVVANAAIMQELQAPIPADCPGPYWLASGIVAQP